MPRTQEEQDEVGRSGWGQITKGLAACDTTIREPLSGFGWGGAAGECRAQEQSGP